MKLFKAKKKSKEWNKTFNSYMKTLNFWKYNILSTLVIFIPIKLTKYLTDSKNILIIVLIVSAIVSYIPIRIMFNDLEKHMNKYGFSLDDKTDRII